MFLLSNAVQLASQYVTSGILCLFVVFLALKRIVVVFSQPGSGL
jgi:hypothetical protein